MVETLVQGGASGRTPVAYFNATARKDGHKHEGTTGEQPISFLSSTAKVAPVDGPDGEQLRALAIANHKLPDEKPSVLKEQLTAEKWAEMIAYPWEPSTDIEYSPSPHWILPALNSSDIPFYVSVGWYDYFARSPLRWFANLTVPKKVMIGPWTHSPTENERYTDAHRIITMVEQLRWFDYWLKDINNGIMDEPGLHYAVIDKDVNRWAWRAVDKLPDPLVKQHTFFFDEQENELILTTDKGKQEITASFTVDYTVTTGRHTRFYDGLGMGPLEYPEMSKLNSKGLFYTSAPLTKDIAVLGYPVIRLDLTSTAEDALISVYLEKVLSDGRSIFVTDGAMKASRRVLKTPSYNNFGLPSHDGSKEVVEATPYLSSGIARIELALMPTGMVFEKGSRIRVAITGADADNYIQTLITPPPDISIFGGGTHISSITLPIIEDTRVLEFKDWVDPR